MEKGKEKWGVVEWVLVVVEKELILWIYSVEKLYGNYLINGYYGNYNGELYEYYWWLKCKWFFLFLCMKRKGVFLLEDFIEVGVMFWLFIFMVDVFNFLSMCFVF